MDIPFYINSTVLKVFSSHPGEWTPLHNLNIGDQIYDSRMEPSTVTSINISNLPIGKEIYEIKYTGWLNPLYTSVNPEVSFPNSKFLTISQVGKGPFVPGGVYMGWEKIKAGAPLGIQFTTEKSIFYNLPETIKYNFNKIEITQSKLWGTILGIFLKYTRLVSEQGSNKLILTIPPHLISNGIVDYFYTELTTLNVIFDIVDSIVEGEQENVEIIIKNDDFVEIFKDFNTNSIKYWCHDKEYMKYMFNVIIEPDKKKFRPTNMNSFFTFYWLASNLGFMFFNPESNINTFFTDILILDTQEDFFNGKLVNIQNYKSDKEIPLISIKTTSCNGIIINGIAIK